MERRRIFLLCMAGWTGLTLILTSIPRPGVDIPVPGWDKLAHFGFYGVTGLLCALWRRECGDTAARSVATAALFVALLGAADEAHQRFIPGRSMDLLDWAADAAGGVSGAAASSFLPALFPFLLSES